MKSFKQSIRLARWCGLACVLGGVLWIAWYLSRISDTSSEALARYQGISFLPLTLFLVGLIGLYAQWDANAGRGRLIGFILALLGLTSAIIANLGMLLVANSDSRDLATLAQLGGIVVLSIGMVGIGMMVLGVSAIRARALPRWNGTPLAVGLLGLLIVPLPLLTRTVNVSSYLVDLAFATVAVFGIAWMAAGYTLWPMPFTWVEQRME